MTELAASGSPAPIGSGEPGAPSVLSIASMASGLVGVMLTFAGVGLVPAIAAVITGHLARTRDPGARAFWLTGMISGYVGIALSLVLAVIVIVAVAIFVVTVSGALAMSAYYR